MLNCAQATNEEAASHFHVRNLVVVPGNETGYVSSFARLLRNTMMETNHAVKEEKRPCSPAKPTPTATRGFGWTTTRPYGNCPATSARANACSTSVQELSRWPSC